MSAIWVARNDDSYGQEYCLSTVKPSLSMMGRWGGVAQIIEIFPRQWHRWNFPRLKPGEGPKRMRFKITKGVRE